MHQLGRDGFSAGVPVDFWDVLRMGVARIKPDDYARFRGNVLVGFWMTRFDSLRGHGSGWLSREAAAALLK
jgi:hypothetical protein